MGNSESDMRCDKLGDEIKDGCLCSPTESGLVDNFNDMSYITSKIFFENNCDYGPTVMQLKDVKGRNNKPVYKIVYREKTKGNGKIGAINRELTSMAKELTVLAKSQGSHPQFTSIINPQEPNKCVDVYSHDYNNYRNIGITKCKQSETFTNYNNNNNKTKIYKLYLLTTGSIIVFLMYKLFQKNN